ncbi:methyltransferase domain-containing protein [uncultured Amphritea sp.]|uniref:class I SAM-dependent methyltransferase n=1 Tax=uncultured Amphritea sp. TaxID=981605 RepID=UPI002623F641|nr:methyltransferase domain-containing protein [uncultured Amphritea sp.]
MSRADLWNRRYRDKTSVAPELPVELQQSLALLPPGHTLDLACGDGAASLYLAGRGHRVLAVDFAIEGLKRLQRFVTDSVASEELGKRKPEIETREIDLSLPDALSGLGRFDNIVLLRYLPETSLLQRLPELMTPGAYLLIKTLNSDYHRQTGFPERFCLQPEALKDSLPALTLVKYENGLSQGALYDSYLYLFK